MTSITGAQIEIERQLGGDWTAQIDPTAIPSGRAKTALDAVECFKATLPVAYAKSLMDKLDKEDIDSAGFSFNGDIEVSIPNSELDKIRQLSGTTIAQQLTNEGLSASTSKGLAP